ncbi:LysR family transcriptional regulator [Pseudomonas chlororaphis]|uniref:LysR family transcriptional regulator n=1 Tax=Pseudomonas chlororaphis TaxID=587753 RepID=A0A1Q8ER50_9PSED|nr:LysR family transcriptional regulator [Pseudomonas chlororaphis]OLF54278.1 LysR family transcriptional regulator [Pseudomonas chlororaphis]
MNKLSEMHFFVAVVDTGSISEAARLLGTTKSMVSQRIQQLEKRLGSLLFERGRQLRLTEPGQVFYHYCVRILADVEDAEDAVQAFTSSLRGSLRLSAPMAFSIRYLTPILAAFAVRYPDLRLDIEFDDRYVNLQEENFDAAIRLGALPDSSLIAKTIAVNRHVICASPAYLATHGTPQTVQNLAGHHALLYVHREPNGMWRLPVGEGLESFRVERRLRTNNAYQLLEGAKAGMGLAILPTFLAADAILAGELKVVLEPHAPPGGNISAVYRQSHRASPKLQALIGFLSEQIGSPPVWEQKLAAHAQSIERSQKVKP